MWIVLIALLLVFAPSPYAQEVYRSTDSDGVPLFSDRNRAGAEKLEIEPLPTIKTHSPAAAPPVTSGNRPVSRPARPVHVKVTIDNPADDSVVWATGGPVAVFVATEPAIRADTGDTIGLRIDGSLLAERYKSGNISLTGIERGTHTLQAVVFDSSGRIAAESETITFHVKRHSILHKR